MADLATYYPHLLAKEGGYVFDPHDPGGETWRGIARVFHPDWKGWAASRPFRSRRSFGASPPQ